MDGYEALVRPRSLAADMDGRASDAGAESLVSGPLSISLHKTPHVNSKETGEGKCCYGVRVQGADGAEFYYTSDSEFREDLGERFPDASAYFHDTTFIPRFRGSVHSHYEDLKRLPADVRRRVVLMHYTEVPEGVDVGGDGFMAAALKHETWEIDRQLGTRSAGTDPLKPTP